MWQGGLGSFLQHGVSQHLIWVSQCKHYGPPWKNRRTLVHKLNGGRSSGRCDWINHGEPTKMVSQWASYCVSSKHCPSARNSIDDCWRSVRAKHLDFNSQFFFPVHPTECVANTWKCVTIAAGVTIFRWRSKPKKSVVYASIQQMCFQLVSGDKLQISDSNCGGLTPWLGLIFMQFKPPMLNLEPLFAFAGRPLPMRIAEWTHLEISFNAKSLSTHVFTMPFATQLPSEESLEAFRKPLRVPNIVKWSPSAGQRMGSFTSSNEWNCSNVISIVETQN